MSRVGQFLIARPTVELGFFKRSVVFIYEDSADGVAGLAVTTPSTLTLRDITSLKEVDVVNDHRVIYRGGPIAPNAVMMLHTEDFSSTNTLHTGTGLNVSSDNLMIEKLLMGNEPQQFRLTAGCSAWAPGQLEMEIKKQYWLVADLDPSIVFNLSGDKQWEAAVEQVGRQIVNQYF